MRESEILQLQWENIDSDHKIIAIQSDKNLKTIFYEDENDKARILTIGDRKGGFSGMLTERSFDIVLARQGSGGGMDTLKAAATIHHRGKRITIKL